MGTVHGGYVSLLMETVSVLCTLFYDKQNRLSQTIRSDTDFMKGTTNG